MATVCKTVLTVYQAEKVNNFNNTSIRVSKKYLSASVPVFFSPQVLLSRMILLSYTYNKRISSSSLLTDKQVFKIAIEDMRSTLCKLV